MQNNLKYIQLFISLTLANFAFANEKNEKEIETQTVNVVAEKKKNANISNLKDDIIKTEVFSPEDVRKSGSSNLIDSIKNSVGISDQNDCSICDARGISLNQLPNGYTTLMIDGIPIFSSVAGVCGLDMIDTNGISAIEVSRGAGVSVIAPEALAGTVNLVTKRPEKDMISGQTIFGNYGTQEVMLYGVKVFKGGAVSFSGSNKERKVMDSDNNGISESARYERKLTTAVMRV